MIQETKGLRIYASLFLLLTFLFSLRVSGQFLVAFFDVAFLPPMEEWYSGLIPYSILLPTQILILVFQIEGLPGVLKGTGFLRSSEE